MVLIEDAEQRLYRDYPDLVEKMEVPRPRISQVIANYLGWSRAGQACTTQRHLILIIQTLHHPLRTSHQPQNDPE